MSKRILVLSDLHCGHKAGLTPPEWQTRKDNKWYRLQNETWDWYTTELDELGVVDLVVVNGDAIDGKGARSGGTELITADRQEQADMAIKCIEHAKIDAQLLMTYGTGYHTGDGEDWEKVIANHFEAKIGSHEWVDAEGVIFDFKHHIGGSGVPHGRSTSLNREALWSHLWTENASTPRANILIRSHVHYHAYCGDLSFQPELRMTTPALQSAGTKYGSRRCSGTVDYGFVIFEIENGEYYWDTRIMKSKAQTPTALVL